MRNLVLALAVTAALMFGVVGCKREEAPPAPEGAPPTTEEPTPAQEISPEGAPPPEGTGLEEPPPPEESE